MLHVVLFQPEIPPNTGNVIRLCANTGAALHLIEPLGFRLRDSRLRRAGLDYHDLARVQVHADWHRFTARTAVSRIWAFTTRGSQHYCDARFRDGDALVFGPESRGLPAALLEQLGPRRCLRLPMLPGSRSLNLSNAVAVALYEAWRQLDFAG
ncbi:MAG: tRNA (uridine(34)/cytosine(34)/5-carboxymethylaminomethyluridine(34)-2'-O)-methyltransferase TrmL [Xanthomonadales bacterium]|nr:tRNA (uridine(34)/cytosine(34)/5-carboxymethylaminomethyluridine(34)-2'-O)-methyltransferase TrmL [Xanthomonadales bacterium]NIN60513.1 tRNA (uridine(34)/cytosine(34)/5-carboxymethylaminomethyluridine(34)-2'-O)-methyltransferase TrmL [Xanthomonadales bacterium]NIN75868.1 tRNA (uridine(34)/cytosine(34)/5-carboxymethylaminomethyluridine(34)-2'-O)-methyltransferase TrmL [Xanthomonadales bacterium]NIO15258.1 tRNA (uridine(34)/cytosine(34)/5-carboxymethylaminomethyluridine(34)-2'-O)-methyltransfer